MDISPKKRTRYIIAETVGELKKYINNLPDEMMLTAGKPYNFVLLEEYVDKKRKIIKLSEYNDGDEEIKEERDMDGWYKIK